MIDMEKRLRALSIWLGPETPSGLTVAEAADEIERLTAANQAQTNISRALQAEVERLRADLAAAVARAESAVHDEGIAFKEIERLRADLAAAVARAEKAETALVWIHAYLGSECDWDELDEGYEAEWYRNITDWILAAESEKP